MIVANSTIVALVEANSLSLVEKETIPPQLKLTDEALAKRYPPKNRRASSHGTSTEVVSAPLEYRRRWLQLIEEVEPLLGEVWRRNRSLSSVLDPACAKLGLPPNKAYQVLYRFLGNRCSKLSVIPLRFYCGNKGEKRVGKGFSFGRRSEAVRKANGENTNFKLTSDWLQKIADTYQETLARGVTSGSAYSTFLNLHCIKSAEVSGDETSITYLPIESRPSKNQFLRHGPAGDPEEALWRKKLLPLEFEKNFRPLDGNTTPITLRTGLSSHVDASSNDRYLVSIFNRAQTIGTARAIPVVDQDIGYIWGFYCGFRINGETARLAILNAATDKIAMCARYGILIEARDWYSHLAAEFVADRGEFNCEAVKESLGNLNRSIEYVATGRADLRGRGERTHGQLHDHNANGSTFGKFRTRGERDPALDADQNIFDFTRELIRRVLYHNNSAPVEHLLTTEMRQAGVRPIRRDILEYSMKMGYHQRLSYDEDDLILALAPQYDAVVTEDGAYPIVRRNIDSGDEIVLKELRYLGPFIAAERWLENVRRTYRRIRIKVRMNPNDPSSVWYQDPDTGLHRFDLATRDPLLQRLGTLHDLTLRSTEDTINHKTVANEAAEEMARIQAQNQAERKVIAQEKRKAIQNTTGKKGNSSKATGRRTAMQKEVAAFGQSPVPIAHGPTTIPDPVSEIEQIQTPTRNVIPLRTSVPTDIDDAIQKWMNGEKV